jgi:hypothetical protein
MSFSHIFWSVHADEWSVRADELDLADARQRLVSDLQDFVAESPFGWGRQR